MFPPVLVSSGGSLPLTSLSFTGLERLLSSCVREGVRQHALAVVATASQVPVSSRRASRVPSLFCGPVGEGPVPGSSSADVHVRGQSCVLLEGAAVGSLVSTEPAVGPSLPVKKSSGGVPGKNK